MKRVIIIFILFCLVNVTAEAVQKKEQPYSKNQVVLNLSDEPTIFEKKKAENIQETSLPLTTETDLRQKSHEMLLYKDVHRLKPEKQSLSKTIDKNITPNTSVGATYKTTEKSGELDDSVSVFTKYKKDKFSFTSAYGQNKEGFKKNGAENGTASFTPEIELNKHVSVKNVYSDNMTTNQQSNEVVLSVKPFKDDKMDIDLGAGQTFSTDNQPAKSQLNLSTKIRF